MRSLLTILVLLTAATTAAANADVQDVRLRVQALTRPDGVQSATLTGVAARSTVARPIIVTLDIDGAVMTLTGRISRGGRLRAIGRRLALATPLASFTGIDLDVSGGLTTSLAMAAGDCVASSNGRRLDCVESAMPDPTPSPTSTPTTPGDLTDGAYDLTMAGFTPPGSRKSGSITTNPNGTRALQLWVSALDFVTLTMAADGALAGYYVWGGDAFNTVSGSATDGSTIATALLAGSFSGPTVGTYAFSMERTSQGTDGAFGGGWNLTFVGGGIQPFSGTAVLDLTVPATGLAAAAPTTLVRNGGMTAFTTAPGTCTVSPAGGTYCMLRRSIGAGAVYLHGALDAEASTGQGTFAIGAAPSIESTGTWTATR